jgi:hypothetical protein
MEDQLVKIVSNVNRGRVALALHVMQEEAYKVNGVRTGAYDGERVMVNSDAWAIACMMLPRKV